MRGAGEIVAWEEKHVPCSAKVSNSIRRGSGHAVVGKRATSCRILPRPSNLGDLAPTAYGYGRHLRCFHAGGEAALRRTPEMRQILAAEHLSGHTSLGRTDFLESVLARFNVSNTVVYWKAEAIRWIEADREVIMYIHPATSSCRLRLHPPLLL